MTKLFQSRVTGLALGLTAGAALIFSAYSIERKSTANTPEAIEATADSEKLHPNPDEPRIAVLTARLLQQLHYSHQTFNDTVSSNLLTRYINDLDPQHLHFLQSDIASFETYRFKLDDLLLKHGDVSPAREIFSQFYERLKEHIAYTEELLKTEKFEFKGHEKVLLNRKDAPYPKDMAEAKKLWRERLRYEYLMEKLTKEHTAKAVKNAGTVEYKFDDKFLEYFGTNNVASTNQPPVKQEAAKPKSPKEIHHEVVHLLQGRNTRTLKAYEIWDANDVLEHYLTALAHLYDPHSDYLGKSQSDDFSVSMNLALFGIGAKLISDEEGFCKISDLVPGPAAKSKKISKEDKIIAVAQSNSPPVDVMNMPLYKVVSLIRGEKGTEVRLTIIPAAAPSSREIIPLIRDEIKMDEQQAKAKIIEIPSGKDESFRFGIISLPSFYSPMDLGHISSKPSFASVDVAKLLKKLKDEKVSGVILDLRNNGGGSLDEAIKITGLFIKDGPVVQVRDWDGTVNVDKDMDSSITYDGPLMVLTTRFSASASEIVAGALQDYSRALLVGESSTHGKGTVQSLNNFRHVPNVSFESTNDPGSLKVTIRKFYRPSGSSTQLKGVVPDIVLPSRLNVLDGIGENSMDYALPWDTIDSAKFDRQNRVEPYLAELKKRSDARVTSDKEFEYVREDMAQLQKLQLDKTASLNEAEQLKEREQNEARDKARDKERRTRTEPEQKVYDITLKLADEKGLPPPTLKTNVADGFIFQDAGTNKAIFTPRDKNDSSRTATVPPAKKSEPENKTEVNPQPDPELTEAEHILTDYLSLMPKETILTINRTGEAAAGKP